MSVELNKSVLILVLTLFESNFYLNKIKPSKQGLNQGLLAPLGKGTHKVTIQIIMLKKYLLDFNINIKIIIV